MAEVSHGCELTCPFLPGFLLFGLHVGSNWNLSDGQEKSFCFI